MPPSTERREFFRVEDRLYIEFREVDAEESQALEKSLGGRDSLPESYAELVSEVKSGHTSFERDAIYAYLETLDSKLNMILDLLSRKEQVVHGSYMDVVLSGSGLKFSLGTRLEEGVFLDLRMVLPSFPRVRISALGRVVRCRKLDTAGADNWETAVTFVAISEKDRDVLVRYVFSRERELLRTRHEPQVDEP